MAAQPQLRRWLFLEQKSAAKEWGATGDQWGVMVSPTRVDCVEGNVSLLGQDAAVVVCFLEAGARARIFEGGRDGSIIGNWQMWCHYGNDVHATGDLSAKTRWQTWPTLSDDSREAATKANGGVQPQHYSSTQNLPWKKEIDEVKALIRESLPSPSRGLHEGKWKDIQTWLSAAWKKAGGHVSVAALIQTLNRSLPDLLAAKTIRGALPQGETGADTRETARQILALFRDSGFGQFGIPFGQTDAPIEGDDDERISRLTSAFEKAWFARSDFMELLRTWEDSPSENAADISERHEKLLRTLIEQGFPLDLAWLEREYWDVSETVTSQLKRNPRVVGGRR